MPVSEVSNENKDAIHHCVDSFKSDFYNPLSLSGYLTPLQRKKLREMRNLHSDDIVDSKKPSGVKKVRSLKRKREHSVNVSSKYNAKVKRAKEGIPQVQCTAAKIIKTAGIDENKRKFFKTSSLNRLEKANFTMPLVLKKKLFLDIDKQTKETLSCIKKRQPNASDTKSLSRSSAASKSPVSNADKENLLDNFEPITPSCVLESASDSKNYKIEKISGSAEEKLLLDFDWPSDEELLKRQEKARANYKKLNCLKESNVNSKENSILKEMQNLDAQPVKLYPIFHLASKQQTENIQQIKSPKNKAKKKSDLSKKCDQNTFIDAGQKEIGAKICSTCNMLYTVKEAEDEKLHASYHNDYLVNLKFPGWKKENVIGEYSDGRVIIVRKNESAAKLKKIEDILMIANRDLGFPSSALPTKPDLTFVVFISNTKQVAGCIVAEPISSASQVLLAESESALKMHLKDKEENPWRIGNWYSSSEKIPALCGINRIWVAHAFRRGKVASRMIDCLRCNFIYGYIVGIRELAFTDPSPDGRAFAAAYTGTDNFLVYK